MRKWFAWGLAGALVMFIWWASADVPVPRSRGNWAAQGATPEAAAAAFVDAESAQISVAGLGEATAKVRVVQSFRGDDSAESAEYVVRLRKVGAVWQVESATYDLDCRRGWSFRGSPCV